MSSGAGQPISPTLSPEVQEVMADWAKTLEAPGANPGLLPMRGVGGDSRSRRKLEQHLRARHAEELGWFYGWKRFLAERESLGSRLVQNEDAIPGGRVPKGMTLDALGRQLLAVKSLESKEAMAAAAFRWSPTATNRLNLAYQQSDLLGMGSTRDWTAASATRQHSLAAVCNWRADAARLAFESGDYLLAANYYASNVEARGESLEAISCVVVAALAGLDTLAARQVSALAGLSGDGVGNFTEYKRALTASQGTLSILEAAIEQCTSRAPRELLMAVLNSRDRDD